MGRVVLIALQLIAGWFGAPQVERYISIGGDPQLFIKGAIFAALVWLVGALIAQVLNVGTTSPVSLMWALAGGLVGGALIVAKVPAMLPIAFPPLFLPLGLAVLGYHLRRR